jgi:hypothetical protein
MLVCKLNKHGKPLTPCKPRKARILLKQKKLKLIEPIKGWMKDWRTAIGSCHKEDTDPNRKKK